MFHWHCLGLVEIWKQIEWDIPGAKCELIVGKGLARKKQKNVKYHLLKHRFLALNIIKRLYFSQTILLQLLFTHYFIAVSTLNTRS